MIKVGELNQTLNHRGGVLLRFDVDTLPAAVVAGGGVITEAVWDPDLPGGFYDPWRASSVGPNEEGGYTFLLRRSAYTAKSWPIFILPAPPTDGGGGAPASARYVILPGEDVEPENARKLVAGSNVMVTDNGSTVSVAAPNLAPNTPKFLVLQSHAGLQNERVLLAGAGITVTEDSEAGEVQIDCTLSPEVAFYEQAGDETSLQSNQLAIGVGLRLDDAGDGTPVLAHNFEGGDGISLTEEVAGESSEPTGKVIISSTVRKGTITISGSNTSGSVVLSPAMANGSYNVQLTPSGITGSPGSASHIARTSSRATGGFTVNLFGAPGPGTDITFAYLVTP